MKCGRMMIMMRRSEDDDDVEDYDEEG